MSCRHVARVYNCCVTTKGLRVIASGFNTEVLHIGFPTNRYYTDEVNGAPNTLRHT